MVRNAIWKAAGMAPDGGYLCIGCLEARLGRKLSARDFKYPAVDPWDTARLRRRLLSGAHPTAAEPMPPTMVAMSKVCEPAVALRVAV
jgi:hypothetical protein